MTAAVHLVFDVPFHGEATGASGTPVEIHDGVLVMDMQPGETITVKTHDYGGFVFTLGASVEKRMDMKVPEPFYMQWAAVNKPSAPSSPPGFLSKFWPVVLVILGVIGFIAYTLLKGPSTEGGTSGMATLNAFADLLNSPAPTLVFVGAMLILGVVQALTQGETGWREDLWAGPALILTAIVSNYAMGAFFNTYIKALQGEQLITAVRVYSLAEGFVYGFLVAQLHRAITVQRTARQLDLSPLAAFATLTLVAIHHKWINGSAIAIGFYTLLLIVSIMFELLKKTAYPQPIYASRGFWGLIGVVAAFIMMMSNSLAYVIMALMLALIVAAGYAARESLERQYGEALEALKSTEVIPWIGLEVALNFWFWTPIVVTSVMNYFGQV